MSNLGDETMPGGDPTIPVDATTVGGTPPTPPPPTGGSAWQDAKGCRNPVILGLLILLFGLLVGVAVALALSGGDDSEKKTASSTTTSSSTSTSTSTTTTRPANSGGGGGGGGTSSTSTTLSGPAPVITSLTNSEGESVQCQEGNPAADPVGYTISWSSANATKTELAADGRHYDTYPPSGSAQFPFDCAQQFHTYKVTAFGPGGQVSKTLNFTINEILK